MSALAANSDTTLNIERRVERVRQEHTYTRTETITRRTYLGPEGNSTTETNMPQYTLDGESNSSAAYGHVSYATNGLHPQLDQPSPSPSPALHPHLNTLRTKQQHSAQQVATVTQLVREVQHLGPDGQPIQLDYATYGDYSTGNPAQSTYGRAPSALRFGAAANYEHIADTADYRTHSPSEAGRRYGDPYGRNYADYEPYPRLVPRVGGPGGGVDYAYQPAGQQGAIYRDYADGRMDNVPPGGAVYVDRPPTPPSPSERSDSPGAAAQHAAAGRDYMVQGLPYAPAGYAEMESAAPVDRYAQSPYGRSAYANVNGLETQGAPHDYGMSGPHSPGRRLSQIPLNRAEDTYQPRPPPPVPTESMAGLSLAMDKGGMRWRDPDLHEVIAFLSNPNAVVKANAAAYLQHLCYNSDPIKQQTRLLGGIPPLVALLNHEQPEVQKNACGALRNLSYGRQNDENKRALHKAGGIPSLVKLLQNSPDPDIQELVTGVLWNLSSCEELKRVILDEALVTLVAQVIIPHSGWDKKNPGPTHWTALLRNSSGVLRNVSSAGIEARQTLRKYDGLVEALLYLVRGAIDQNHMDNKSVENVVCILRNLSYRCEEVVNPNYDKQPPTSSVQPRASAQPNSGENQGCFGASRKKKDSANGAAGSQSPSSPPSAGASAVQRTEPAKGMELLWQPDVVQPYLALLSNCSNPETLEAAAGAIQNLAACYWQPSIDIRAAVRKEKGLPVLVELLRMEVDRVVCAVATALRNLALDQRNKELIGKYAMRDLVQKLPSTITSSKSQGQQHDMGGASDDTIAAVLATLNEVVKKNAEFARSLLDEGGVDRLVSITRQRQRYSNRVSKFASQVLGALWTHQELRDAYKKAGYKESDFVSRSTSSSAGNLSNNGASGTSGGGASSPSHSAANSTLNRPMSSQGGTRYEDKTLSLQRQNASAASVNNTQGNRQGNYRGEDVPLADMQYPEGSTHAPPAGGVRIFPPGAKPGEPVYAQVNREKKRSRQYDSANPAEGGAMMAGGGGVYEDNPPTLHRMQMDPHGQGAGDSWV